MKKYCLTILCFLFVHCALGDNNKVTEYQLKNGLKLIVQEDHRAPIAIAEVWYKVGSSYEPLGITGISHVLEHMMFRGSKKFSKEKMNQLIAENGIQQNAFTFYDFTGYYELGAKDQLPLIFDLEADRMRNLLLTEEDFKKEIQIVMEERRMRTDDSPQQQTLERFFASAYIASPYHHLPIGWMSDLQNMKIEDVRKWYQTWYAPNNAVLVVVGDVKPQAVYELAQKYFGELKPENIPQLKPSREIKSLGTKSVEVEVPAKLPFVLIGYNIPSVTTASTKWEPYALSILAGVLSGGDSSRLPSQLVRGKQIASAVNVGYDPYFRLDNLLYISAVPTASHQISEIKSAVLEEITNLQQKPISADEINRVKAQLIASKVYMQDDIANQANQIGNLAAVNLPWQELDNFINQIKKITPEQVQAMAKKYLVPQNATIAELKPLPLKEGDTTPSQSLPQGGPYVH